MKPDRAVRCSGFPCEDIRQDLHAVPNPEIDPERIRVIMISEAPAPNLADNFYSSGTPFFVETTTDAFRLAGFEVKDMSDVLNLGVYITTAVKCGKVGYGVSKETIKTCSTLILENELSLFPATRAYMLMGDVAIKAFNNIVKKRTGKNLIPTAPTYKVRKAEYSYDGKRVFPSYLQTGKSYLIEKSKQKMIAEDIRSALKYAKQ